MRKTILHYPIVFFISFFLFTLNLTGQTSTIVESYDSYSEAPRELAYVHLNKSTYIEGEMLGFTAYVFDKFTKEPSKITSNLYCTISNAQGEVIKKKLIRVEKGISSNVFEIDSTLSTGIFTFKAYTNWMKNFEEQNHFEQTFKVIDADNLGEVKPISPKDIEVDLQLLGEGGHIVYDISNTIGVIAKNQFGYGIANAYGNIKDNGGEIISEFQLNSVGLAKTLFTPQQGQNYTANLILNGREIKVPIKNIKQRGIVMNLVSSKENVSLKLVANKQTLSRIKKTTFKIALHNGSDMVLTPFKLNNEGIAILSFLKQELFDGINIFTVFDNNTPILERLHLNVTNIKTHKTSNVSVSSQKDSLHIDLRFSDITSSKLSNLSVSVLPTGTKSYNHHNNLLSQLYIQPYVKGFLQNGKSYFLANDRESDYNRDLLMLTQGWSSYNWDTIFSNNKREYIYPFERGIDVVANLNQKKYGSYVFYPLTGSSTQFFEVPKSEDSFTIKTLFPNEDDLFRIGYLDTKKKNFNEKPSLYLQFYPSEFSDFKKSIPVIQETYTRNETYINPSKNKAAWDNSDITELQEVVVKAENKYTKFEALNAKSAVERYDVIKENIKKRGMRVDIYLQRLGFGTYYDIFSGKLTIINGRSPRDPVPLVYLDNALLTTDGLNSDFSILTFITMDLVEYIEYELYGIGGGIRGSAGYIKIFTNPGTQAQKKRNSVVTYEVPLLFNKEKNFYTPKYKYYNTDFFKEYGTLGWEPKVKIDNQGLARLSMFDTSTNEISLFIEGIVNGNEYVSQQIEIDRN